MIGRIKDHTQRIEKHSIELDRAYHQTRSSFEIIQKIGAQTRLKDVSAYLIMKFRELVSCSDLVLLILNSDKNTLFVYSENEFKTFKKNAFESV